MIYSHLSSVRRLVGLAERAGIAPGEVLARGGLAQDAELVLSADLTRSERAHWLPIDQIFAVWDCAAEWLHQERLLCDVVASLPPEGLGPLGFQMLTASTLEEGMVHLTDGFGLVTNSGSWERRVGPSSITFVWRRPAKSIGQCLSNEAILAHVVKILGDVSGEAVGPIGATFQHAPLGTRRALATLIPAPIEFDAPENTLTLPRDVLEARARLTNRAMGVYFRNRVEERLELLRSHRSVVDLLRRELSQGVSFGEQSLLEVSDRMGLSARTLQRRLETAATSFSAEVERARRDRAFQLVTTTRRPLGEIAAELGFADASSFSRAFRRWFTEQPGALRRAHATK